MALNPEARRAEGVSQLTSSDLEGSRTNDGQGVNLPTATYSNPGPTANLRGIEANTGKSEGPNIGEPVITQTFGSEVPRGEVFNTPEVLGTVVGPGDNPWRGPDSSASNSHVAPMIEDSFCAMGEKYPANGGVDGES